MRDPTRATFPSPRLVALMGVAAAMLIIVAQSPQAVLVLCTDGLVAAGILLAGSLAGLWLVALFRFDELPLRWHLLLGAGFGIGALCLLILLFGLLGWLHRALWIGILAVMGLGGLPRLVRLARRTRLGAQTARLETRNSKLQTLLWLLAAPFAALSLLVAPVPAGLLWAEEGNGYDVLEYHLQMPREYLEAGHIAYAPHNVYANFPSNAEMLYLLAMIVQGDPIAGAGVAQLINAGLAFLAVAAAWLAGSEISPAAGHVAGVLAATCGWLVYLSGVAYVENLMLFFGMLSAAVLCRTGFQPVSRQPEAGAAPSRGPWRRMIAAGLLAGLSAGCKYTAFVLIAIPLGLAVLFVRPELHRRRIIAAAAFGLSALASFAPWMLKNAAFTGNPVFPLANSAFRAYPEGWSAEKDAHFARCHSPATEEESAGFRLTTLWDKVLADEAQRFGPAVFLLAVIGSFAAIRSRESLCIPFAVALLAQVVLWLAFTHLYARFAVAFLIPLVILGGGFVANAGGTMRRVGLAVVIAGGAWNLAFIADLYRGHLYADGRRISIEGAPEAFTGGLVPGHAHHKVINGELPADAKVLLVGEARAFYFLRNVDYRVVFNRDPFIELLQGAPSLEQVRAWLTERGITHIYVAWSEIRRLGRSRYGFHGASEEDLRAMVEALMSGGVIRRTHVFSVAGAAPYAGLYNVVRP